MKGGAAQPRRSGIAFLWWAIVTAAIVIPLTFVPSAKDPFRIPKELEFRALGIIVITTAIGAGWKRFADKKWRTELVIAAAACGWAAIATLFSVNRALSISALFTIIFSAVIFLATCVTAQERKPASVSLVFLPAVVNAFIMISQALGFWNPFHFDEGKIETALLGNRNDAGAYLLAPAIAAFVLAGVTSGRRRSVYGVLAAALLAGLLATQTASAIIAYVVALAAFVVIAKREYLMVVAAAVIIAATVSGLALLPRTENVNLITVPLKTKFDALVSGNLDVMMSGRLGPFLAAWHMFLNRPIIGVGPGVFPFEYLPRRLEVEQQYATQLSPYAPPENFGETHNDHLQVLAETGVFGYLIFVGAGIYIASFTFRKSEHQQFDDERVQIARHLAFPLVSGFAVLALWQFPIELAAARMTFIFFGAICCAWWHE
jgi:O-antigen ligase